MNNNTYDYSQNKTGTSQSDKHKHKPHYHKDKVNEITSETFTQKHTPTKIDDTLDNTDIDSSDSTADSALESKCL